MPKPPDLPDQEDTSLRQTPFRILHVLPALKGGGVEEDTIELSIGLKGLGCDVWVMSSGGQRVGDLKARGIHHLKVSVHTKNPWRMLMNAWRIRSVVKHNQIHLVHVHSRAPAWSVRWACGRRIPWVATYHGAYGTRGFLKRLYNNVMLRAWATIAVSPYIARHIQKIYGRISPHHLSVILRGIDPNHYRRDQCVTPVQTLRETYAIPDNGRVILLPGRPSKRKGHALFLEALSLLRKAGYPVYAFLVGGMGENTPYIKNLQALIKILDLEACARFLPYQRDLRPFYAVAEAVVVPSLLPEAFGRVIVEAFAMEATVIASQRGAAMDLMGKTDRGFLFSPDTPEALAGALSCVFNLPKQERHLILKAARAFVEEETTLEKSTKMTYALYQKVLQEGRGLAN
jgi:glycosyltransferase involved in cell wall biosynthesis